MEKLTLEQIAPYPIGENGIRVLLKNDDIPRYIYSLTNYSIETKPQKHGLKYASFGWDSTPADFKPILRPMDLTKPIQVEGKEIIPVVELAEIAFPKGDWKIKDSICMCYIEGVTQPRKYQFYYDDNSFSLYWSEQRGQHTKVYNQLVLFQWLFKHKFDVFGLIEKGLAIDVNTLETNPYK